MRPDHTATEFVTPSPTLLASPLESASVNAPRRQAFALTRVTFCFAWLFGLEPFLSGSSDDVPRSGFDRH